VDQLKGVVWVNLVQHDEKWRAFVNMVMIWYDVIFISCSWVSTRWPLDPTKCGEFVDWLSNC
jgi:hypothetical protein